MPPDELNNLEPILEAQTLQNEEIKANGEETNSLLQALIASQENDNDSLLEARISQAEQHNKELKEAIKESNKNTLNLEIDGVSLATIKGETGEKGDKGDKGDTGPQGESIKGDKGDTGERGPAGLDGRDGVDGIGIKGDKGDKGDRGTDGKDGLDGVDGKNGSEDTPKQIKKKLESLKDDERLDVKAIKGIKDFQKQLDRVAGFASQGQEYRISGTKIANNSGVLNFVAGSGATITGVPTSDGATITIGASGGGGAVDSVNGQTGVVVLDTGDIAEATDLNYVSDAQLTVIGNTSGTNTGDVTVSDSSEIDLTLTGQQISASIVSGSIDESKLDASVNASLDLADTAVQPAGLSGYELLSNKATDFTTVNNTLYPTVQAVNTAINTAVTGLLDYRGSYDASTNLFPATGGSGLIGAILSGDFWVCSVAGTLGGTPVTAGDLIIAIVDTPGQTASNWDLIENTLGYTPENAANKVTSISGASTDTQYPSAKLLYDQLALKAPLISPSFTTPSLGVATATSINGATITSGTLNGSVTGTNTGDQTITNSSDATSHTVTLSASGGSVQLIEGSNITLTTGGTGSAGTVTIAATAGGTGDVVGPASATDNAIARFDSTTGKLIQNSAATIADTTGDITAGKYNTVAISGASTPTLAVTGTTTVSGANTGDQTSVSGNAGTATALQTARTIGTATGDVTSAGSSFDGSANNTNTLTIANSAVTLAKMANLAQDQFIGRTTASTGVPETATITAAARTVLDDTTVGAMVDTLGGASSTGTGGLVRATSPTLVTPALGTPSSGNLSNCTGIPAPSGIGWALKEYSTATASGITSGTLDLATDLKYKIFVQCSAPSATSKGLFGKINGVTTGNSYWNIMQGRDYDGTTAGNANLDFKDSQWNFYSNAYNTYALEFDLSLLTHDGTNTRVVGYSKVSGFYQDSTEKIMMASGTHYQTTQTNVTSINFNVTTGSWVWKMWIYTLKTS